MAAAAADHYFAHHLIVAGVLAVIAAFVVWRSAPMFPPKECFKGAIALGLISWFIWHSVPGVLLFAGVPAFFGAIGLLGG